MSKTFGTMTSTGTTNLFAYNGKGLDNISDILTVLEELHIEENSEKWNTLLDSRRELLSTFNMGVKLNSTTSKSKAGKLYFFNDMLIIGHYKRKKKRSKQGSKVMTVGTGDDNFFFGELTGRANSGQVTIDDADDLELQTNRSSGRSRGNISVGNKSFTSNQGTLFGEPPSLKLKLWMDLENVDCRRVTDKNEHGIRCSCTIQETYEDEETGEIEYSTEVQQVQFYFENAEDRDTVFKLLQNIVDELLEKKIRGDSKFGPDVEDGSVIADMDSEGGTLRTAPLDLNSSKHSLMSVSSAGTARSKKRSYAAGKATMRKQRLARNKRKSGTEKDDTLTALTLDDIVSKYKSVLDPTAEDSEIRFKVTFGPGSMGFALSSIKESGGVFVGRLEAGGMAEVGNVTLGDRVIKVGTVDIDTSMEWKDVIEVIKAERSMLDDNGKPRKLDIVFARAKEVDKNVTKKLEEAKKQKRKDRVRRRGGKRAWTKHKTKSFGSRMASLKDISDKYTMKIQENEVKQEMCVEMFEQLIESQTNPVAKKCAHIMKELYDTERKYLSDLYLLIDNFMKPLSKKTYKVGRKQVVSKRKQEVEEINKPLMTKQQTKALFGNVELIVKINESLLSSLESGLVRIIRRGKRKETDLSVADVVLVLAPTFTQIMPFFKIYSHYAYQYSNALEVLSLLKENPFFVEELQRIEGKQKNESLNSLLTKPISRLCKYPLIFATLNGSVQKFITQAATETAQTGVGDVDKLDKCLTELLGASEVVADIATSIDVKVGTAQDLERLHEIYLELGGQKAVKQFMIPSRRFIGKYQVLIEDKTHKKSKMKPHIVYLFNDLVIFAVEKSGGGMFGTNRASSFLGFGSSVILDSKSTHVGSKKSSHSGGNSSKVSRKVSTRKRASKSRVHHHIQVRKEIKIETVRVRKNAVQKDELFGFTFTQTQRKVTMVKKTRKREAHEQHDSDIYRYEMWFPTEEARDELLKNTGKQVKAHKDNVRAKKKINQKLKPELKKRQRQWKSRARKLRQKSMQQMEDEATEPSATLEEINLPSEPPQPVDE